MSERSEDSQNTIDPLAILESEIKYDEYLENFEKNRPIMSECTGPMTFGEWVDTHDLLADWVQSNQEEE